MPLDEWHGIICERVILCFVGPNLQTRIIHVVSVTELERGFLSDKISFYWLCSIGSGNFPSNSTSKMRDLALHLGKSTCMLQLPKLLCKSDEVGNWGIMERETWDEIRNGIVSNGDPIGMDPHWIIDHEAILEDFKDLPYWGFSGTFDDPSFRYNVVSKLQEQQEWVICLGWHQGGSCGCHVIEAEWNVFYGIEVVLVCLCYPCHDTGSIFIIKKSPIIPLWHVKTCQRML